MSAWTWTYIKVTAINREQGLQYCDLAEKDVNMLWYYEDYLKLSEEKAFRKYLNFFKGWKDELNISKSILNSPKKFEAWVKERYYENIKRCTNLLKWIEKYRNEECTFEELVNNSNIGDRSHCRIKEYKGDKYIEQYGEIFRLRQYDTFDLNLHTVEDLIDYLSSNKRQQFICDFAAKPDKDGNTKYEGLTYALAKRIREHYGKIGDNNFIVNFG